MLCRAILTAIVITCMFARETLVRAYSQASPRIDQIKDVICVLILSGLQKEDLDANTLEKLRHHNVDFYNMNNESIRKECLLKPMAIAKDPHNFMINNHTTVTTTHKRNTPNENIRRKENEEIKKADVTKVLSTIPIEYVKSQPNLLRMINYWTNLQQNKTTTQVTTSTPTTSRTETLSNTLKYNNNGVNYNDINNLNNMLANLFVRQTEATTPQVIKDKTNILNEDIIAQKIKELIDQNMKQKELKTTSLPTTEDTLNNNRRHLIDLSKFLLLRAETETVKPTTQIMYNNLANLQNKLLDKNTVQNMETIEYISNVLRLANEWRNTNAPESVTTRRFAESNGEYNKASPALNMQQINEYLNNKNNLMGKEVDVLQSIAEKLKEIMMKDVLKMTSKEVTTQSPTTITMAAVQSDFNKFSDIEKLFDLLKQWKSLSETTNIPHKLAAIDRKLPRRIQSLGKVFPPVVNQPVKKQDFVTFQTNSLQIPPLAIEIPGPMGVISQIIVTTQNPYNQQKSIKQQSENMQGSQTYTDLPNNMRGDDIRNEYRNNHNDRFQELNGRVKQADEYNRFSLLDGNPVDLHGLLPSYQGLNHVVGSGHQNSLTRPWNSNYYDNINQPIGTNQEGTFNRPRDSNNHQTFNYPRDTNIPENMNQQLNPKLQLNQPLEYKHHVPFGQSDLGSQGSLTKPGVMNRNEYMNRQEPPRVLTREEILNREVLARLLASNPHSGLSGLVNPNVLNGLDLNHQRSHHSGAYERIEHESTDSRYKGTRFHEELERIDNMPSRFSNSKSTTACCDIVASRNIVPLNKLKQRPKFDDKHFRDFLKSQQKVTEILEKMLASKSRNRSQNFQNV